MKTNYKLVAGGIGGLLTAIGLMAALLVWADQTDEAPRAQQTSEPAVEPVPVPALDSELATTHLEPSEEPADAVFEAPAPEPEPPSYEPTLADGAVRLRRLVIATGVRGHEPTGTSNVLELGAQRRVYAFVEAVNETDEEVALEVTFEPAEGESTGHVSLDIPAGTPRWRTWAWTRHVYTPGAWEVVVRGPDGRVIARRPFDVVE